MITDIPKKELIDDAAFGSFGKTEVKENGIPAKTFFEQLKERFSLNGTH